MLRSLHSTRSRPVRRVLAQLPATRIDPACAAPRQCAFDLPTDRRGPQRQADRELSGLILLVAARVLSGILLWSEQRRAAGVSLPNSARSTLPTPCAPAGCPSPGIPKPHGPPRPWGFSSPDGRNEHAQQPAHWRKLAEQTRRLGNYLTKQTVMEIAQSYEQLAVMAETRARASRQHNLRSVTTRTEVGALVCAG